MRVRWVREAPGARRSADSALSARRQNHRSCGRQARMQGDARHDRAFHDPGRAGPRTTAHFTSGPRSLDFADATSSRTRRPSRRNPSPTRFAPADRSGGSPSGCASRMRRSRPCGRCFPGALAAQVRAGPIDEAGWSLLCANAGVAAKLRQLAPQTGATSSRKRPGRRRHPGQGPAPVSASVNNPRRSPVKAWRLNSPPARPPCMNPRLRAPP